MTLPQQPPSTSTDAAPSRRVDPTSAELTIWYVSGLQRCNFTCSYCASGQPLLQRAPTLPTWSGPGPAVHEAVVAWLTSLPYRIRLRVNSLGEPFVSRPYLESIARLTQARNLSFVEILSNGSYRPAQLEQFLERCDPRKLSLWITFHHQFTSPAALVDAAALARARGVFVVVNALVFPDNMRSIEELIRLCQERGIPFVTGTGINFNRAYPTRHALAIDGLIPELRERARALADIRNPLGSLHAMAAEPSGRGCAAGGDYFFITPRGDVYPCLSYSHVAPETRLGSVLDRRFQLAPRPVRYAPCRSRARCGCLEDYQNLEPIRERFSWGAPSFGLPVQRAHRER